MEVSFIEQPPTIYVVAATLPQRYHVERYLECIGETMPDRDTELDSFPSIVGEIAGRGCYRSYSNSSSRDHKAYMLDSIIKNSHFSVIEHINLTFQIQDLARDAQMELIRHRAGTAYSWESTRFTDKSMRFVVPPRLRGTNAALLYKGACQGSVEIYELLKEEAQRDTDVGTLKRKRSMEAARSVLPGGRASNGVVTLNARSLRHIIQMRTDVHADLLIREFAWALYLAAMVEIPEVLQDAIVDDTAEHVPSVRFQY